MFLLSSLCYAGSIYLNDCSGQRFIPIWLVVYGSVSLFHTAISCVKYFARIITKKEGETEENRNQRAASRGGSSFEGLLSTFLFIWTIVGSVWVFSFYYSTWLPENCTNSYNEDSCGCHPVPFFFSYATLLVLYCLALLICCVGCCCVVCLWVIGVAGASSQE